MILMGCSARPLPRPKIAAIATDKYLTQTHSSIDPTISGAGGTPPKYGQDWTFGSGRAAPLGHDVGKTEVELKPKMRRLIGVFASNDQTGMAIRLFDNFLAKQSRQFYFDDTSLNQVAAGHTNIKFFCDAALSAPNLPNRSIGKTRIHQALKSAGWDISKLVAPTDLGVPAFNIGDKAGLFGSSGDFANGLGVMINGVQHVYVLATHYCHDAKTNTYSIRLKYIFYDVFGLDDDDLLEYGSKSDGLLSSSAGVGITAWWQLQHQHSYAPLITRIIIEKTYDAPAV
jgi:hypothetical protein